MGLVISVFLSLCLNHAQLRHGYKITGWFWGPLGAAKASCLQQLAYYWCVNFSHCCKVFQHTVTEVACAGFVFPGKEEFDVFPSWWLMQKIETFHIYRCLIQNPLSQWQSCDENHFRESTWKPFKDYQGLADFMLSYTRWRSLESLPNNSTSCGNSCLMYRRAFWKRRKYPIYTFFFY